MPQQPAPTSQSGTRTGIWLAAGIVLLGGGLYLAISAGGQGFIDRFANKEMSKDEQEAALIKAEFAKRLGSDVRYLVHQQDINMDQALESIAFMPGRVGQPAPDSARQTFAFRKLAVASFSQRKTRLLLQIDEAHVRNESGQPLVPQQPASYGYSGEFFGQDATGATLAFAYRQVDSTGKAISDDLILYWDPVARQYTAEDPALKYSQPAR